MDLTSAASFKNKEKRETLIQNILRFEEARKKTSSQRQAAELCGIARSTAQYREKRQQACDLDQAVQTFFNSPAGLDFLHQLCLAAEFSFSQLGGAGIRVIQTFYELSQLDRFVACSEGSLQGRIKNLEDRMIEYGQQQEAELAQHLPEGKKVTLSLDETFPSDLYLVAMEPVSNFIVLEEAHEKRDCATWNQAMQQRLSDLSLEVIQVTSDQASALIKYTHQCLGAHPSPDLFHIQQDVSRGTSFALKSRVKAALSEVEQAHQELARWERAQQNNRACQETIAGPPLDYATHLAAADQAKTEAEQRLKAAQHRCDAVRQANRSLGEVYHPFDLKTGAKRRPQQLRQSLNAAFDTIETHAREADLSDNSFKKIAKARRRVSGMVSTLAFFWSLVALNLQTLKLPRQLISLFHKILLPAVYLGLCAHKASSSELKREHWQCSEALYAKLEQNEAWRNLPDNKKKNSKTAPLNVLNCFSDPVLMSKAAMDSCL